jgi:shikimate kinase
MGVAALKLIFLSGFMASGKSAVGHELAIRLGVSFLDLDELVEARVGLSVGEIFAQQGEVGFREFEAEALAELTALKSGVVALGGGTVVSDANRRMLRQAGCLVWLNTPRSTILVRLAAAGGDRPLYENPEQAARLFEARLDLYRDCDLELRPQPQETVAEIASRIAARPEVK